MLGDFPERDQQQRSALFRKMAKLSTPTDATSVANDEKSRKGSSSLGRSNSSMVKGSQRVFFLPPLSKGQSANLTDTTESTMECSEGSNSMNDLLMGSCSSFGASSSEPFLPRNSSDIDDDDDDDEIPRPLDFRAPRATSEVLLPSELRRLQEGRDERARKTVSWSQIEIYHHAVMLGDNPAVSSGPPLALGPERMRRDNLSVLDYEASRPPRREKYQMALPRSIREDMLRDNGYARSELSHVEAEIQKIKKFRKANSSVSLWEKLRHASHRRQLVQKIKHGDENE